MNIIEAIQQRKSVRAFLDKEVTQDKIDALLSIASHAPSGANIQPWQVAVVTGDKKQQIQSEIETAFRQGDKGKADYQYYPQLWTEPYKSRRFACGMQMYSALNIDQADKHARLEQWMANYRSFDAPVMLLFFMEGHMQTGSFLDYGLFLQSLMLAAMELGLASCPQAALADYPDIIKQSLGYPEDWILICGISLGYEDKTAAVNSYRTPREPVSQFTQYFK